ncbi:MAG: hypothetical protein ACR2HH_03135 [Chthoniobacterales bacterium]
MKPLWQAAHVLLLLCVGIYAMKAPRTTALVFISLACFITVLSDGVYLMGSLQTEWHVTLFAAAVRRVLFVFAEILFIVEVFLWPLALFLIVKERRNGERQVKKSFLLFTR